MKLSRSGLGFRPFGALLCVLVLGLGTTHANVFESNRVDAAQSMEIYQTIDSWVRELDVSDAVGHEPFASVTVTLRLEGRVIGRGQMIYPDPNPEAIPQATQSAIAQAKAWVRRQADAEPDQDAWASIASRLTLSVELVDRVVPIRETQLGLPFMGLSPGVDGLVMYLGGRSQIVTPEELISSGVDLHQAAYATASELSEDGGMALASIEELLDRGYTFARCTPIWIAQPGLGLGGVFIDRGSRVIDDSSVGTRSIREMGERIAGYLIAQRWPGAEQYGMTGTRNIVTGRASPEVAPIYEQAFVAYALFRFAQPYDKPIHARAREIAFELLDDLGAVQPGEPAPWDDAIGSAACVIALSHEIEGFHSPEWMRLEKECRKTLAGLYSPIDGFSSEIPTAAQGLVAWALVRSKNQNAEHAVRAVFRDTEPGQLVSQMPFLGWAELELARGKERVPAAGALNQMRSRMWDHQLISSDLEWQDRDFAGAVVFTKGASVLPASGNLRPIAMVCTMLGDPRLTPGTIADPSIAKEIGRVASAMRFVDQLVMSETSAFLSRSPKNCVGGVRVSLWDWRVSPVSSAIALIAAIEFERSIGQIGVRKPVVDEP